MRLLNKSLVASVACTFCAIASAQSFRRLGACPTLGCVFPPDQADFLAGQYFDIRTEVHAPVNGSEKAHGGRPDTAFTLKIAKRGQKAQEVSKFFGIKDSPLETWKFTYFEDYFARDAGKPTLVNVAAKAYRRIRLQEPGHYTATLTYYNGETTVVRWFVRSMSETRRTKNILLFIGDGMTTNMITAARLIGHKTTNGRYTSRMAMDRFPILGHQMSHSIDSFITDSANSATALYSGHKSTVNALGVYRDSSPDPFDDPRFESIAEIFRRKGGHIGIVSTAFLADATPAAFTAHTRDRNLYPQVIDTFINGQTNFSWPKWGGADVVFGGGAEQFFKGGLTFMNRDYYNIFKRRGYNVVNDKTSLLAGPNRKTLGVFCQSNLPVWLDRNIYKTNLGKFANDPKGGSGSAQDLPGLKDMTLKAIDILEKTSGSDGWFLMSEAASVDKQMHTLDYDRALGDLLELDDTVRAAISKLSKSGSLKETLVLVTADHGHGFDVMGSVDTKYLEAQSNDRDKRTAIGTYSESGLSQYVIPGQNSEVPPVFYTNGSHFPANWDPRYTLFSALGADPDRRENYQVHKNGPRLPAVELEKGSADYYANPADNPSGILINGTLPVSNSQGVHSLTDVPVYAMGPCQELFGGTYNNIDIFFAMAECLGLSDSGSSAVKARGEPSAQAEGDWELDEDWWFGNDHWGH